MNLSRRSFLVGTAAAIAVAPLVINSPFTSLVTATEDWEYRIYMDLMMGFEETVFTGDRYASIDIFRVGMDNIPVLTFGINTLGFFRWSAPRFDGLIVPKAHALDLRLKSEAEVGHVHMIYDNVYPSPPEARLHKTFVEEHVFAKGVSQSVTIMELSPGPPVTRDEIAEKLAWDKAIEEEDDAD